MYLLLQMYLRCKQVVKSEPRLAERGTQKKSTVSILYRILSDRSRKSRRGFKNERIRFELFVWRKSALCTHAHVQICPFRVGVYREAWPPIILEREDFFPQLTCPFSYLRKHRRNKLEEEVKKCRVLYVK